MLFWRWNQRCRYESKPRSKSRSHRRLYRALGQSFLECDQKTCFSKENFVSDLTEKDTALSKGHSFFIMESIRNVRPFYAVPLLFNLILIFSTSSLLYVVNFELMENPYYPIANRALFFGIALMAPLGITISQSLPQPWIAQSVGGILVAIGLVWTGWSASPLVKLLSIGFVFGTGLSLSMQSLCIIVSPYFVRSRQTGAATVLFAFTLISALTHSMMVTFTEQVSQQVFYYLGAAALLCSLVVPVGHYLYRTRADSISYGNVYSPTKANIDMVDMAENGDVEMNSKFCETEVPQCQCREKHSDHTSTQMYSPCSVEGSWLAFFLSGLIWLLWGAAIDTTLLALDEREMPDSQETIACLQLFLCFIPLAVKLAWQHKYSSVVRDQRLNLASNYMQLGLLGSAGVVLSLFPELSKSFHNHLLFTIGFALQYDDLQDLIAIRTNKSIRQTLTRKLFKIVKYMPIDEEEDDEKVDVNCSKGPKRWSKTCVFGCTVASNYFSQLLLALFAIMLGFHLSDAVLKVASLPLFHSFFQRASLLVLSAAGVGISLCQPDFWIHNDKLQPVVIS